MQYLSTSAAQLQVKLGKAELNRFATQKQAEAASKQTLAMLEELDALKDSRKSKGGGPDESAGLSADELKKKLTSTENRLEEAELKAKIIQENYVKLVDEYSQLEKQKETEPARTESKKNK